MRSPWHREYVRTPAGYIWGTEPSPFAREVSDLLPTAARVLDLGCGEGRDSVFFAGQGFDVVGVDVSRAGLRKAERLARERGVKLRWLHGDMARLPLPGRVDLVYSCGTIHYVPRRARVRLFRRLKALTLPGGYHAHIVFTDRAVYQEKGEVIEYFVRGELSRAYADWRVLQCEEQMIPCAQDGTPHRHSVEQLVARAVGAGSVDQGNEWTPPSR
jgi:tellurite methyltransferase